MSCCGGGSGGGAGGGGGGFSLKSGMSDVDYGYASRPLDNGGTHHTVYHSETNVRMSWDTDAAGNKSGQHITDQDVKSGRTSSFWSRFFG